METFIEVFTQLGVDSTLVPQFIIIVIVFILAHFLFLGKLQQVIETREEKTVKLEGSADQTIEKVEQMQVAYKAKIEEANKTSSKDSSEKKQKISQKYVDAFKETEKEVNTYVDQSREEFTKEVEAKKSEYMAQAEALSDSLVNKIIQ